MFRDYFSLTKPKVVVLIVFTAIVGMLVTDTSGIPPVMPMLTGVIGIACAAASAAVFNHVFDARFDVHMQRTASRPIPTMRITPRRAVCFAVALSIASLSILLIANNTLTALLTLASIVGYAVLYTVYLKHATPQNIVIGGLAGAAPPVLGYSAVTGTIGGEALLLCLIIFVWTPPHFWALAIHRCDDYAKAGVPMLPITHGIRLTKQHVALYVILLIVVTLLPVLLGMSGLFYLAAVIPLNVVFAYYAYALLCVQKPYTALGMFRYSIAYLFLLFAFILFDHYWG